MKKRFDLAAITPVSGCYLTEDFSEYFNFLRHMVGNQEWFLKLINDQEKIHEQIFKSVSSAKNIDHMLIKLGETLLANTSKETYYFVVLRSCIAEYVAKHNMALCFLFVKIDNFRDYVVAEVEKTKAAGNVKFDFMPIPKAELDKLFTENLK